VLPPSDVEPKLVLVAPNPPDAGAPNAEDPLGDELNPLVVPPKPLEVDALFANAPLVVPPKPLEVDALFANAPLVAGAVTKADAPLVTLFVIDALAESLTGLLAWLSS
jgi:hypothetical protein